MSDNYYLVGKTLSHSLSREIHNGFGAYSYDLKELLDGELAYFIAGKEYKGLNVTIPHKRRVAPLCDKLSEIAARTRSVNTVVNKDGELLGYNTDYYGFLYLIEKNGIKLKDKDVYVLGDGGAALTVRAVAEDRGAKSVRLFSHAEIDKGVKGRADILVNCTPVGMYPSADGTPVNLDEIEGVSTVIDLIYNPARTRLLLDAKDKGLIAVGGLRMLVAQAAKSCELFCGKKIDDDVIEGLYDNIRKRNRNIVLIGMGGAGKSALAKALSALTGADAVDTDYEIERTTGLTVSQLIEIDGEANFRRLESEVVKGLFSRRNVIVAAGGGAILSHENLNAFRQNGVVIYIECPVSALKFEGRPLYPTREALVRVFEARKEKYEKAADIIFFNDHTKNVNDVARELLNEITCY